MGSGKPAAGAAMVLLAAGTAYGAEISLSVDIATAPGAVAFDYNPRGVNGLLAVASAGYEFSGSSSVGCPINFDPGGTVVGGSATGAAAGYGSDTSIDPLYNSPLLGTAVEPMADVQVSASVFRGTSCIVGAGALGTVTQPSGASVSGSVAHRVILRPINSGLGPLLDALVDIPVRLDYALATQTEGNATAFAGFYIESAGQRLFEQLAESPGNEEVSGTWSTILTRSTDLQEFLYTIRVYANAHALPFVAVNNGSDSASAQAVADPFLYVDPDWEYAQYFMVQQESVANPGSWAEVTREWRSTVVPVPGALWLGLSACGALLPWARRRGRTTTGPSSGC